MKLLLDSGAYSCWRLGDEINLGAYIDFVKSNELLLEHYVSLDVIPGVDGRRTNDCKQIEQTAARSYANHQTMKDAGLRPIPVFHQDDHPKWLERYLDDHETYVCLATHGAHPRHQRPWLDECYRLLRDKPHVRVHGLGISTTLLLRRYQFSSVDSSTWTRQAGFGRIIVPFYIGGRPDYRRRAPSVTVSERSSIEHTYFGRLRPYRRAQVERFLSEEVGVDLAQVRNDVAARWRANAVYFNGLARAFNTRLFFVTNTYDGMRQALLGSGAHCHLLSFYELKHSRKGLERYVDNRKDNESR